MDEDFSIDQNQEFDVVRAGLKPEQLNDAIAKGCDNNLFSKAREKWVRTNLI